MRRRHTALALASAIACLGMVATGCSNDESGGGSATTSSSVAVATTRPAGGAPAPPAACETRAPGVLMTEAEAVIRFSPEQVCPGYVTVTVGTSVTWKNLGSATYTVTVKADPTPDAPVYLEQSIEPGATWVHEFTEHDQYSWSTDALPSFVGAVDIRA